MLKLLPLVLLAGFGLVTPSSAQGVGGGVSSPSVGSGGSGLGSAGGGVGTGGTNLGGAGGAGDVGGAGSNIGAPEAIGESGSIGAGSASTEGGSIVDGRISPGLGGANPTAGTPGALVSPGDLDSPASPDALDTDLIDPPDSGTDPIIGGAGGLENELRATQGSTSINSVNAGAIARTGVGTAAAGTLEGSVAATGTAGMGGPADYNIPTPSIGVDLGAIRRALAAGPSATPKANGD